MLFDMHVHMYPDRLAKRAIDSVVRSSTTVPRTDATLEDTGKKLKLWGVTGAAVMNIATKPHQQTDVNNWAARIQDDFFHCFGSVHPAAPDAVRETFRIRDLGLYGIKLHPDYQHVFVDDRRFFPVYDAAAELHLPITFHAGMDPLSPKLVHAPPEKIARIARMFPKLTIIAAHLGGMRQCDEAEKYVVGLENVYLDTAMSFRFCSAEQARRMILKHGTDRVLFASDCPWSRPTDELRFVNQLNLSSGDMEKILFRNALQLLHLSPDGKRIRQN